MSISGFSYVRNGFDYGCPFIEAITSILPLCDEFVVAVGDSTDGTRDAIVAINSPKIKIIDTVWDMNLRSGGRIFAQQANIALDHITGDWAFHIQADEVVHEDSLPLIAASIEKYNADKKIDGFILPFLHFWGDYNHIRDTRKVHKHEVRLFRNDKLIRSYRDSQGFRKYKTLEGYDDGSDKGEKLNVKKIDAPVYHYNGVRSPQLMNSKNQHFGFFYGVGDIDKIEAQPDFDLHIVDRVRRFLKTHPVVMMEKVETYPYTFEHDKSKAIWKTKDRLLQPIEDVLGFKFGEYKNYKLV
jgi:glycosyltransferase involved in cell wall biosynthesis